MIGFPLRLLARECDRCAIKGRPRSLVPAKADHPPDARYLLGVDAPDRTTSPLSASTEHSSATPSAAMSLPTACCARAAGNDDPGVRASADWSNLVPGRDRHPPALFDAELCRFVKLSRLPKRSAIVAFSAKKSIAIAVLRRFSGARW